MKKNTKGYLVMLATVGVCACLGQGFDASANEYATVTDSEAESISEVVYDDSNVSISSALDRYIAFNSGSALDDILGAGVVDGEADETVEKVMSGDYIDFSNKAIVTASGQVNIRSSADVNSSKVGIISGGGMVTVLGSEGEWSHITSGGCDGYIKSEFLVFGNDAKTYAENNLQKVIVINATTLRLRADASEDSECLTMLTSGEEYGIIEQGDAWTNIEVDDSLSGYVKNDYISVSYRTSKAVAVSDTEITTEVAAASETTTEQKAATTEAPKPTQEVAVATEAPATEAPATEAPTTEALAPAPAVNADAGSVVSYALQFVGNPYVYGGSSLTNGTDCSGFTMSVYANFGVYLPHSSASQANCGTEVSLSEAQAGDLIFYKNGGTTIGHVALCIGGGQVVHASTEKTGIIVSNMYYSTPCKAVRVY